ncbi:MAG: DsbA family protein [Nocardioidaceae bacterium]
MVLHHLAADRGLQGELKEALLAAYQTQGEPIADHEVLTRVAVSVGLVRAEVTEVLAGDAYAADVRADQQEARRLRVGGVPFFVFDRRYGVSGAQPSYVLLDALRRAWDERSPVEILAGPVGLPADSCGPDVCEVPPTEG